MIASLILSERGKIYYAIADVKRAIMELGKMSPRTQQIENAIEALKAKDIELQRQSKDHKYLEGLAMKRLVEVKRRADNHSKSQSEKASRPRATNGIKPEDRKKRNDEIKQAFEKKKISANSFYIKYAKKHKLSAAAIRKIVTS
jgi:membrane protein involved in colicin uptake